MEKIFGEIFEKTTLREICSNSKEVLLNIKKVYPNETYANLSSRAKVHIQTLQRWSSIGRADADAIRRLIKSFTEEHVDDIFLKDATPQQIYQRCSELGWDKVILSKPIN